MQVGCEPSYLRPVLQWPVVDDPVVHWTLLVDDVALVNHALHLMLLLLLLLQLFVRLLLLLVEDPLLLNDALVEGPDLDCPGVHDPVVNG